MNFFEHQATAKRHTRWLVLAFVGGLLITVALLDLVLVFIVSAANQPGDPPVDLVATLLWGALGIGAFMLLATTLRIISMSRGGSALARSLGAVQVAPDASSNRLRRLRNVVEEMAIASGVPMPELFVLETEAGINAFAAGFSPADAAICVTAGALDGLSRDELQGVIAHEFSHVLNGDMRLNLRLLGMLFGLLVFAVIGRLLMQVRGKNSQGVVATGLLIWLVGSCGLLFGRLIKASVSRRREFLADASAVQFTRQTEGLSGALKKAALAGTKLDLADREEVAHMLFGDGIGYGRLFATHPPLVARLQRLDPQFDPTQLDELARRLPASRESASDEDPLGAATLLGLVAQPATLDPAQVPQLVGQTLDSKLDQAGRMRRGLAPVLKLAARSSEQSPALLLALLLDPDAAPRERQLRLIRNTRPDQLAAVQSMFAVLGTERTDERLPLAQLAFPSLKQRPLVELQSLLQLVQELIHIDGRVALFEYCLGMLLSTLVQDAGQGGRAGRLGTLSLTATRTEVLALLSVLAALGTPQQAAAAFADGARRIYPLREPEYAEIADWQAALDHALPQLDQLAPPAKSSLIEALSAVLVHDGVINVAEGELLRALCARLHCPLPPLFDGQ